MKNQSKNRIFLLDLNKTCSCTAIELPQKEIASGETMKLQCRLDTNGCEGKTGAKVIITYTEDKTDDSMTPPRIMVIDLMADVEPYHEKLPIVVSHENP